MSRTLALVVPLALLGCSTGISGAARPEAPPSQAPEGFWDHWGDGRAELAGYRLVQPRYGAPRTGEAVLVTVTEDFLSDDLTKAERGQDRAFPVVKLNEIRDFPTGVYDYNLMTSSFLPLDGRLPRGLASKVSFSSQEWCGHVWDMVQIRGEDGARRVWHSYFDGEADGRQDLEIPPGTLLGDALPLLVRDLAGPLVEPGAQREVPYWPRLMDLRLDHREGGVQTATLAREAGTRSVSVPAGTFEVRRTTLTVEGRTGHWDVELAPPHRLVAWGWDDGEAGVLTGSTRMPYWQKNGPGDEGLRAELGLGPHPLAEPAAP
jgi:hypothetical protein